MKKIIIFGASGNVGSYMAKYMKEYFAGKDYEVIASGRRQTKVFDSLNIPYISVDITDAESFEKLPTNDVYAVVHLAATIPAYMNGYIPEQYLKTNILGTWNVLEYCRRVNADRILFSTTVFDIALYAKEGKPLKENLPLNFSYTDDHAVYVISKNTGIEFLEHYHQKYGLKNFVFRFPSIYSYTPNQFYYPNGVKTLRPFYFFINQAKKSAPIEIWGDPNYSSDMCHVYDCSQIFCKAIESNLNGGLYNVGTGIPVTLQEKIESIIKVFSPKDNPSKIIYCPEKSNSGGFMMDVTKTISELGYKPVYTFEKLLQDFKEEMAINRFAELRL